MDPTTPLHQDPLHGDATETPHQEAQRTCTRTSPCQHQGCLVCCTPTNHVRNLDEALTDSEATQVSPTTDEDCTTQPPPPPNHRIRIFTTLFLNAIKLKDFPTIEFTNEQFITYAKTGTDILDYDCTALFAARLTATNMLNSHNAMLKPLTPPPLPNSSTTTLTNQVTNAHFKAPTITAPKWSGKANEFYTWLHNLLNGFKLADCADQVKLKLTLEAIPMDKQGLLNDITEWERFKERLIEEFGSIDVYGRDVNQDFALLTRFESVQECAEVLAPKIKKLQSNLNIMQEFFDLEILHNVTLTQQLVHNIMKSLPLEVKSSFNEKYADFRDLRPENVKSPITFEFLAKFVYKMEKNYRANPSLYDLEFSPARVGVKATRPEPPKSSSKPLHSPTTPKNRVFGPCSLCTIKGFQDDHFALGRLCGAAKLSSPDILKIITDNHLCPTCTLAHDPIYKCYTTYKDGRSKICTKGCMHGGFPVHHKACMHNNQAPFVTVGKVDVNKSVPLVEDIQVDKVTLGVQYDTGCQLSLISKSALSALPPSMYSLGTSSQIRVMTYAGEGNTILTTPVKLKLPGITLILSAIEEDLNNGSGFSFPVPRKWRSTVRSSTSQHSGQVSILLGGDNNYHFPKEIERDSLGLALYQSKLTSNYLIYGPIPPNTITWSEPIISPSIKTVFIHSVNVQTLQDNLVLLYSAEEFTTPSNRSLLAQKIKEKGVKDIMDNTFVDLTKNKVCVKYLYKPNLANLGENYFGATKRINALHNKIYNKPEITSEMDKYIQQQVDNGNYVEINPDEHRDHHQLHFVAYNFVVSNTSTSTKVRMTTDSSMRTESGLSLNDVTQPAPGNVPSLRGILMRSRSHPYYAVYDIKKFFRSVITTDKDSFLRIVCVPSNSFSSHPTPNPTWRYFRDRAIPFGDSASGDYATCAKVATVQTFIKEAPPPFNEPSCRPRWRTHT